MLADRRHPARRARATARTTSWAGAPGNEAARDAEPGPLRRARLERRAVRDRAGPGAVERGRALVDARLPARRVSRARDLRGVGRGQDGGRRDVFAYAALRPAEVRDGRLWLTGRPDPRARRGAARSELVERVRGDRGRRADVPARRTSGAARRSARLRRRRRPGHRHRRLLPRPASGAAAAAARARGGAHRPRGRGVDARGDCAGSRASAST